MSRWILLWTAALLSAALAGTAESAEPAFRIRVVDEGTGRGVPLVELRTVNDIVYVTDSNGLAALGEPGLVGQRVYFHVRSHGYEYPADGFGFRGKAIDIEAGGSATLKVRRINIAERLYRVTGAGIYRDSVLLGEPTPTRRPLLNGQVLGSDSVMNAVYRGRIHWFWGDTNQPSYPLGNFHTPGATSELPAQGGLDPRRGVNLTYSVDERGFAKPTAEMPGSGPTWISGLTVLRDADGRERMFAGYAKVKPPMDVHTRGLCEWDDEAEAFRQVERKTFPKDAVLFPDGHPFLRQTDGAERVHFCTPYPLVRVRATPAALQDVSQYEAYTCLREGTRLDRPRIDRDDEGRVRYGWKRDTPPVTAAEQQRLVKLGLLAPHEGLLQLRDRDTGKAILAHGGSVYWNPFRARWVMIAVELFGTSALGEVWYAEADSPLGPWAYAVKVVTHERYSFYNPKQHPMFDQDGGRTIYFEGTYTRTFSGNPVPTPRYEYNQIMYRLDLGDARLALPVAWRCPPGDAPQRLSTDVDFSAADWGRIDFFAPDRPGAGTVPVYWNDETGRLQAGGAASDAGAAAVFHAHQSNGDSGGTGLTPLWPFADASSGQCVYSTDPRPIRPGLVRGQSPVCLVWPNPTRPHPPAIAE